MKYIRLLILITWLFPLLIIISPIHTFESNPELGYVLLILASIFLITLPLKGKPIKIKNSIMQYGVVENFHLGTTIILCLYSLNVLYQILSKGAGLSGNRDLFDNEFPLYNSVFVITIFSTIMLSCSPWSYGLHKTIARFTWILCGCLLLVTGNRQFVFFSLIYLTLYFLGSSEKPKQLLVKVMITSTGFVFAAIAFSILRLDYLDASNIGDYGRYLSSLTGANCQIDEYCDGFFNTAFLLIYAYMGMNYSGLTYSIDFHSISGGLPWASSTMPVLYRRIESLGLTGNPPLMEYESKYENFIEITSGGKYSHFFSTMFGSIGIEFGVPGIILFTAVLFFILQICVRRVKQTGNEITYILLIFSSTGLIFGIMQFPFAEPFIFFAFINIAIGFIMQKMLKK